MRKIAISLSKGGVGKTTTTINLSHCLALTGYKVLVIDTDTQGQMSKAFGVSPTAGLFDLVTDQDIGLEQAIVEVRDNLWLLAGGRELAKLKREISLRDMASEYVLSEVLGPIDGDYDYVLIDSAPSWDVLNVNTLFYADEILAPVSLEALTLQGLVDFTMNIEQVCKYSPVELKYILPTFYDRRVSKSKEILKQLWNRYKDSLLPPIRYNVKLSEASGFGESIFEFDKSCPGAEDYKTLAERIIADGET